MRSLFTAARELQSGASVTSTATQTPPLSPSLSLRQSSSSPFARPAQSDKVRPKISLGSKRPHKCLLQHSASFPVTAGPAHSPGSLFERWAMSHEPVPPSQSQSGIIPINIYAWHWVWHSVVPTASLARSDQLWTPAEWLVNLAFLWAHLNSHYISLPMQCERIRVHILLILCIAVLLSVLSREELLYVCHKKKTRTQKSEEGHAL